LSSACSSSEAGVQIVTTAAHLPAEEAEADAAFGTTASTAATMAAHKHTTVVPIAVTTAEAQVEALEAVAEEAVSAAEVVEVEAVEAFSKYA
jgi:hypothetical protein